MPSELSERQKFILTLVIHEYIRSAAAVGSHTLVERYRLELSPATVRNELAVLTDLGYLRQPHTSAGRIPAEEGYRYFVTRLIQEIDLPDETRRTISHQFYQMRNDVEQWMRLAASILAKQSRVASLVTAPHPADAHFKHVELIATRGDQVLLILVLVGGEIHQRVVTLTDFKTQENLSDCARFVTNLLESKDAAAIRTIGAQLSGLHKTLLEWILEDIEQVNSVAAGEIYLDGITNVLAEPEFAGSEEARRALHLLEERSTLEDLLSRTVLSSNMGGVQVLIGGEGTWDELRQCSIVLSRYGTPGLATGTLGVLGPMRMPYGRAISTVRFLANLLSNLVTESLVE